jgi:hypothetical protein
MKDLDKKYEVVGDLYFLKDAYFERRTIHTQMIVDGVTVEAKIDSDGVIKPRRKSKSSKIEPVFVVGDTSTPVISGDLLGYTPHWVTQAYENTNTRGNKGRKILPNPNRHLLSDCHNVQVGCVKFKFLDSILVGAANLDLGGNSKPLGRRRLFNMLRDLDYISTDSVKEYLKEYQFTERYYQKLALTMRVLVNNFNNIVVSAKSSNVDSLDLDDFIDTEVRSIEWTYSQADIDRREYELWLATK